MKAFGILVATLCLALAGCGVKGAPMPPSLHLPQPPQDLRAIRQGNKVTLFWSAPRQTTDGEAIRHGGSTRICRKISAQIESSPLKECSAVIGAVPSPAASAGAQTPPQMTFTDSLTSALESANPTGAAQYAVEALNSQDKSAGLSNQVGVPLAPAPAPPMDLKAEVKADGIHLSAEAAGSPAPNPALRFSYRFYRQNIPSQPGQLPALVAEVPATTELRALDQSFAWEAKYSYHVTPATTVLSSSGAALATVEGNDSAPVEVFAHDVFPPAAPTGLEAVFSGLAKQAYIDLSWNANTEPDLAGYNVYRREADGAPLKINNDLVKTSTFRDTKVLGGHTYLYAVSAVDLRGNESAKSKEASEQVPTSF